MFSGKRNKNNCLGQLTSPSSFTLLYISEAADPPRNLQPSFDGSSVSTPSSRYSRQSFAHLTTRSQQLITADKLPVINIFPANTHLLSCPHAKTQKQYWSCLSSTAQNKQKINYLAFIQVPAPEMLAVDYSNDDTLPSAGASIFSYDNISADNIETSPYPICSRMCQPPSLQYKHLDKCKLLSLEERQCLDNAA